MREHRTPAYSINSIREAELAAGGAGVCNPHRQQRVYELAAREWRTPSYCIREVQSHVDFTEMFNRIVERISRQVEQIHFHHVSFDEYHRREKFFNQRKAVQLELFPNG